ncbi:hypothetical protein GE061_011056 [Apolygus lucorum]|uniref:Uncharacterized protein n=1 Tax=Apolygus lucorum TaxID=248454 RepID=A0A8S9XWQ3_APOLU|nr:hypothetical protein GE061_011056 [Apolygus lucorum]
MQDERGRSSSRDEGPSSFQLPLYRDSSRFSTTYSFYEFIDQELREEEERDMLILRIRENIIGSIVDELYDRYMDRQVIPFTVRCFEQSLRRLLNWYFLPRDPEDKLLDWEEDEPPAPVPVDNWASFCVPAGSYPPPIKFKFKEPFEPDEIEDEEIDESDWPNFDEVVGENIDDGPSKSTSKRSGLFRSLSEPGSVGSLSNSENGTDNTLMQELCQLSQELENEEQEQPILTKQRHTHFAIVTSSSDRSLKMKSRIYQWISPKNFPPVR